MVHHGKISCVFIEKRGYIYCMRIIHTSDWHLGHTLMEKTREDEMKAFFSFLIETINEYKVDALLVSGDIFDTGAPSNAALNLYYSFLSSIRETECKDVFVIAGNHDSPSLLSAPKEILKRINVHVISTKDDIKPYSLDDEVVILPIPFPRDQELRKMIQGESIKEENDRLRVAIEELYRIETEKAADKYPSIPIVAMGHLMASNISKSDKRDLYIGGLGTIDSSSFPKELGYVALGHIHKKMNLNERGTICYSGSPIPLSFKEGRDEKVLKLIDIKGKDIKVSDIAIPRLRSIIQIRGDKDTIERELKLLVDKKEKGWVSLEITEGGVSSSVRILGESLTKDTDLEVIHIKDTTVSRRLMEKEESIESLESLSEEDIFTKYLDEKEIKDNRKEDLLSLFREILRSLDKEGDE